MVNWPRRAGALAPSATALAAGAATYGARPGAVAAAVVLGGAAGAAPRHPRAASLTAIPAVLVVASEQRGWPVLFALVPVIAFCSGRWDRGRAGLASGLGLVAAWLVGAGIAGRPPIPELLIATTVLAAARALAERAELAARLADRVRALEHEREAHARLSVRYERARIASELHDIVAHAISVMVVQAGAGQRQARRDPEATAQTFAAIAGAAHQAELDLSRLVALLNDDDDPPATAPDLGLVEQLVAQAAGNGLDIALHLEGDREGLPAGHVQVVYRIVREGLTNALRYAAGARVDVAVGVDPDALRVAVRNGPAPSAAALIGVGTGNGLRGLRESVDGCGGALEAGPTAPGGWLLSARLPLSPESVAARAEPRVG